MKDEKKQKKQKQTTFHTTQLAKRTALFFSGK